jgi:hypothetical protein
VLRVAFGIASAAMMVMRIDSGAGPLQGRVLAYLGGGEVRDLGKGRGFKDKMGPGQVNTTMAVRSRHHA